MCVGVAPAQCGLSSMIANFASIIQADHQVDGNVDRGYNSGCGGIPR